MQEQFWAARDGKSVGATTYVYVTKPYWDKDCDVWLFGGGPLTRTESNNKWGLRPGEMRPLFLVPGSDLRKSHPFYGGRHKQLSYYVAVPRPMMGSVLPTVRNTTRKGVYAVIRLQAENYYPIVKRTVKYETQMGFAHALLDGDTSRQEDVLVRSFLIEHPKVKTAEIQCDKYSDRKDV